MILHGSENGTPVSLRSNGRGFCARNGDGISSFVAGNSIEGSFSRRLRAGSSVTCGAPDGFWRRLLSKSKRCRASHTRSDNGRRGRRNDDGLGAFMAWDICEGSSQGFLTKRTTRARGFLFDRRTSAERGRLCGAGNDVWLSVSGRERPGFKRRSGPLGAADCGWIRSSRLRVSNLRRCGFLQCPQNGGIY